ncbi:hypothetical protein BDP27DRAFT_1333676 [Rhodocollybia butyracea]|uniref:Fungal-type protein kinase domain-containing protein n=1 Tax=Rhodocollybia butyracea TaxID=206335 RepID=A0A9P5U377_9AGAR|nr:hypothetical protein BDP27DRAFT_1333676 [Rhodocollybia butyracea]
MMIDQIHRIPPETLGIISNFQAPFIRDPNSLFGTKATLVKDQKASSDKGKGKKVAAPLADDSEQDTSEDEFPSSGIFAGCSYTFTDSDGKLRRVELGKVLFRPHGILGRGTIVVEVTCSCAYEHCLNGCDWADLQLVMKLSFLSKGRCAEGDLIDTCTKLAAQNPKHAWVLNHLPKVYASFIVPFGPGTVQYRLKKYFKDAYEEREVRGSIQSRLDGLMTLKTCREFGQAIYDILQCHEWVHKYPRILHRDISLGNMMVRTIDGKKYGVLNDFDLAVLVERDDPTPTSNHRTGTRPFMSHEQHGFFWKGPHRARHDLESFFYVTLLLACLYEKPSVKVIATGLDTQYETWMVSGDKDLHVTKRDIITNGSWNPPVQSYFGRLDAWLYQIHSALYSGFRELQDFRLIQRNINLGLVDDDEPLPEFNEETLNGHVTYDTMIQIMHTLDNARLETRNPERQVYLDSRIKSKSKSRRL